MYQAIVTKYCGPTNRKGARISASCASKVIVLNWDHSLNVEKNHAAAARELVRRMGWQGRLAGGQMRDGRYCFVFVDGQGDLE